MEDIKQCIYSKYILMMPSHLQLQLPKVTHVFLIIPFRAVRPTKHTAFI